MGILLKKTRVIAYGKLKTDKVDSYYLAQLLRIGFLPMSYPYSYEEKSLKSLCRFYFQFLCRFRAMIKQDLRSLLSINLLKIKKRDILGKSSIEELKKISLDSIYYEIRKKIDIELGLTLDEIIKETKKILENYAQNDKDVCLLATLPGMSLLSALAIKLELGSFERFPSAKSLVNFIGLRPFLYQSGNKVYSGKIIKEGHKFLRSLYFQAAIKITPKNAPQLWQMYLRLINKGKPKILARVAIARKLAVISWHMMRKKQPFYPYYASSSESLTQSRRMFLV